MACESMQCAGLHVHCGAQLQSCKPCKGLLVLGTDCESVGVVQVRWHSFQFLCEELAGALGLYRSSRWLHSTEETML